MRLKSFLHGLNFESVKMAAIGFGWHAEVFAEGGAEVALVEEAGVEGDIGEGGVGLAHVGEGVGEAATHAVLARGAAEVIAKSAREVDGMEAEEVGHLGEVEGVAGAIVEEVAGSGDPCGCRGLVLVGPEGDAEQGGEEFPAEGFHGGGAGGACAFLRKAEGGVEPRLGGEGFGGGGEGGPIGGDGMALVGDGDGEEAAFRVDEGVAMEGAGGVEDEGGGAGDGGCAVGGGEIVAGEDEDEGGVVVLMERDVFGAVGGGEKGDGEAGELVAKLIGAEVDSVGEGDGAWGHVGVIRGGGGGRSRRLRCGRNTFAQR